MLTDLNGNPIGDQAKQMSAYEKQQLEKQYKAAIKRKMDERKEYVKAMKDEIDYLETILTLDGLKKDFYGKDEYLAQHIKTQVSGMLTELNLPADIEKRILEYFGWAEKKEEIKTEAQEELKVVE